MTEFIYSSPFQEFIQEVIRQKRSLGYKYDSSARMLYHFDQFCLTSGCTEPVLSKQLVDAWSQKRPNETQATLQSRASVVRQLAMYMTRLGVHAYVLPKILSRRDPNTFPIFLATMSLQSFSNKWMLAIIVLKFRKGIGSCRYCSVFCMAVGCVFRRR